MVLLEVCFLRTHEVLGSNVRLETAHPDWFFTIFCNPSRWMPHCTRIRPWSHSFMLFPIFKSSYHMKVCLVSYRQPHYVWATGSLIIVWATGSLITCQLQAALLCVSYRQPRYVSATGSLYVMWATGSLVSYLTDQLLGSESFLSS